MTEQQNPTGDWVVVRRPGFVRLADSVVRAHSASTQSRHRGDTMVALAETLSASRIGAEIRASEPDGAQWSMKITVEDATS